MEKYFEYKDIEKLLVKDLISNEEYFLKILNKNVFLFKSE